MRLPRHVTSGIALSVTALSAVVAVVAVIAGDAQAAMQTPATKDVAYHGYHVSVPLDWPVIDLSRTPDTCVRFDRGAVYLGHPTAAGQNACPAHLIGRTDALLIEPLDAASAAAVDAQTLVAPAGAATPRQSRGAKAAAGQTRLAVPSAGVLVTAAFGTSPKATDAILATGRLDATAKPAPSSRPTAGAATAPMAAGSVAAQPGTYTGKGFDPCAAPDTATMSAWTGASPYQAIGVYIAGVSKACSQPNLTASWIGTEAGAGWHIIPISVDLQAPCTTFSHTVSYTLSTATSQGTATADDAVNQATALGLPTGSVLYDDMEAYDNTNSSCNAAVLTFLSAWTNELHAKGYLSGVYSSAGSGIKALDAQYSTGAYTMPDQIWFAWWNNSPDTNGGSYINAADWANHQRLHQYFGDTNETWGGVTINVDGDYLDVAGSGGGGGGGQNCSTVSLDFSAYSQISQGSTGALVSAAQCLLTAQGYFSGTVNGTFGSGTVTAVQNFQTATSLPVTGTVDSHTWTALLAAGTTPTLQQGSTGNDVKRLQRALNAAVAQNLTVDGDFGSLTNHAVVTYQGAVGLQADGIVGPLTWGALQSGK